MTIWTAVWGYLAVGVVMALTPLGSGEIARQISRVRGTPVSRAITQRPEVPAWKIVAFGVVVTVAMVLAWPVALSAVMQGRRERYRANKEHEARRGQGLEYSRMGGEGVISCERCGFREEITSFMHGMLSGPEVSADEGRQCLQCGKFTTVHLTGEPVRRSATRCECGGELSREHILFCPNCRSNELNYDMTSIS